MTVANDYSEYRDQSADKCQTTRGQNDTLTMFD